MVRSVRSVAVLSDVHGVLPVLEAVLAEPAVQQADLVVVTGDHASGPQPVEVLDRLLGLGERVLLVRGNADRELVAFARGLGADPPDDVTPWAAAQLSPPHVELLAALPHPVTVEVDGFGPVLFCHGAPRDDDEVVLVDTRLERWAQALADVPDAVRTVVCGHTHMPFVRLVDRRMVVNPGSVGMPYGRAGGAYALLRDGHVALCSAPLDVDAAVEAVVAGSTYPDRRPWADEYLRSANSDAEALRAFGPRDGRDLVHHPHMGPPYRRYLAVSEAPPVAPRAGEGVLSMHGEAGVWHAKWLDDGVWLCFSGERDVVEAWARSQPAGQRMIRRDGVQEYDTF